MHRICDLIEIVGQCNQFPEFGECDYWTQFDISETVTIPEQKPDVEQLTKVSIDIEIISQRVVKTPKSCGCNLAGQRLTGKKLILEGLIKQKVFYVADLPEQSVHAAHFKVPFSAFIIIPKHTCLKDKFRIDSYIEDVFVNLKDKRTVFKNITLLLHATPIPNCC